jgi:hypothetical protein
MYIMVQLQLWYTIFYGRQKKHVNNGPVTTQIYNILRYAQDNLGVKKVSAPSKNHSNCPIMSFAR